MTPIIIVLGFPLLLAAAVALAFWTRERRNESADPELPEFKPQPDRLQRRIKSTEIKWEI